MVDNSVARKNIFTTIPNLRLGVGSTHSVLSKSIDSTMFNLTSAEHRKKTAIYKILTKLLPSYLHITFKSAMSATGHSSHHF